MQLKSAMSPPAAVQEKRYTMVFAAAGAMASRDSPEKGYAVYRLVMTTVKVRGAHRTKARVYH